jgi:hypothetical protein
MADFFAPFTDSSSSPGRRAEPVVPSDTLDLTDLPKWLDIGTGGTVVVMDGKGNVRTFKNRPSGSILFFRATRVLQTGTTAQDINAIY